MNIVWRITKFVLFGIILPCGVLGVGYFLLGPNMSLMPRLDDKGWDVEVSRLTHQTEDDAEQEAPEFIGDGTRPVIKVSSNKAKTRRRSRPSFAIVTPGMLDPKPSDATAEITPLDSSSPTEGTLVGN